MDAAELVKRRKALGFSQQRLAHLADCSYAMVGLLERGLSPEKSEVLDRVIAALDAAESKAAA